MISSRIFIVLIWICVSYSSVALGDSIPKKGIVFRHYLPTIDTQDRIILRNAHASFGRKFLRGSGLVFAAEASSFALLFVLPENISHWDKSHLQLGENYKRAFTRPPVVDEDAWYINYLGHPYQGAYTYNAIRSQGANVWQSSLFCIGHSVMWEYVLEAGFEQPSIQDLVVTPCAGILLGELFHFATTAMAKNGFKWYEATFVCLVNPMYAINNGFKFAANKRGDRAKPLAAVF